jgi:hypothetical protein
MGRAMQQSDLDKPVYAGGCLIFIGFIVGAVTGIAYGEPSIGSILGVLFGGAIALLLWLAARSRRKG